MSQYLIGAKVLRRLVQEQDGLAFYKAKLSNELFRGDQEQAMFEFVAKHHASFQVLPQLSTFESQFPEIKDIDTPEPSKYYVSLLESRYGYDLIDKATLTAREILKNNKGDVEKASAVLYEAQQQLTASKYRHRIVDVAVEAPTLVLSEYQTANSGDKAVARFGWPYLDKMCGGMQPGDVVSIIGRPAMGKAQPLDSLVLKKDGWVRMGDLKVGDTLASVDGEDSVVESIHPQGVRATYKLTFTDGRTVEASDEHLWEVKYRDWQEPRVVTTLQLIAMLKLKRYKRRLSITYFSGDFGEDLGITIPPYLLGALIGDGCFVSTGVTFTTADEEILQLVKAQVSDFGCRWTKIGPMGYLLVCDRFDRNPIKLELKKMGLWGKKSEGKFIPENYLAATKETRWELLRGLMDTDGTSDPSGTASYCTTSRRLAEQVQYLVRSLGGKASIATKKTSGLDAYILHLVINDRARLFHLKRKKDRVAHERATHKTVRLTIDTIEYVGDKECQCITVSHPRHLYVTDNFVVTHNSYKSLFIALTNWMSGVDTLFVSMEMGVLEVTQRVSAMYAHTNISQLKIGGYATPTFKKFVAGLQQMQTEKAKFYVVDGNLAASMEDVYTLAAVLKAKFVIVDGSYMVRHQNHRLDRYTRVAENIEMSKRYSGEMGIPSFHSFQFNRKATEKKGKKGEKPGLEDIGYSDAIPQISSVVLGIWENDSVETLLKRHIDVMKGRNGEVGGFDVAWDFITMDFSQWGTKPEHEGHTSGELAFI